MLTGKPLLDAIEQLGQTASKAEMCEATGYTSVDSKTGKTKLLYNTLLNKILEAKGVNIPTQRGSGGPTPSFTTSTLSNGQVVVGKCYASLLGAKHGDSWSIEVDQDTRSITLKIED